ncbi:MAG TPA: hypothetical protein VL096_01165 [Pirellulaceae bacterium]|nr:hypothetical protein [Pirellulaceae bacterium]
MAIDVTCPGCQKSFKVSDQFAGKKGPCPSCKTVISIPALSEKKPEVVIHAPESQGPKDSKGRPVLKPLSRKETKATPILIGTIAGGILVPLIVAVILRLAFPAHNIPWIVRALSLIILAPPLVFGGYAILREQEMEPYRGKALLLRSAICSAVFVLLWGLFAWLPIYIGLVEGDELLALPQIAFIVPLMVVVGGLAAFASLDLSYGTGVLHYALYLVATVLLALIAGVPLWSAG